jgi:hypothetical protein
MADLRTGIQPLITPSEDQFPFVVLPLFFRHRGRALLTPQAILKVAEINDPLGGKALVETGGDEVRRPWDIPVWQLTTTKLPSHDHFPKNPEIHHSTV